MTNTARIIVAYLDDQIIPFKYGYPDFKLFIETDWPKIPKKIFDEVELADFDMFDNKADLFLFENCFRGLIVSYSCVYSLVKLFARFLHISVPKHVYGPRKKMMYWLNLYIDEIKEFVEHHQVIINYDGEIYEISNE